MVIDRASLQCARCGALELAGGRLGLVAVEHVALEDLRHQVGELGDCRLGVRCHAAELSADKLQRRLGSDDRRYHEAVDYLHMLVKFLDRRFSQTLAAEQEQLLVLFGVPRTHLEEVDRTHQLVVDRALEEHAVDFPPEPVREHDPGNAVVGTIVDGLPEVRLLEAQADRLDLDKVIALTSIR